MLLTMQLQPVFSVHICRLTSAKWEIIDRSLFFWMSFSFSCTEDLMCGWSCQLVDLGWFAHSALVVRLVGLVYVPSRRNCVFAISVAWFDSEFVKVSLKRSVLLEINSNKVKVVVGELLLPWVLQLLCNVDSDLLLGSSLSSFTVSHLNLSGF